MRRSKPYYRRSSENFRSDYSLRLLLGWVVSLGLVVLLLNLPLSAEAPRVGWSSQRSNEWIPLRQVATETDEQLSGESSNEQAAAPPPTRHDPVTTSTTSDSDVNEADGTDEEGDSDEEAKKTEKTQDTFSDVRSITSLATENQPQIVGGQGALSLYINYPSKARQKGIQGRLVLNFTVDKTGQARHIRVTQPLHPLCDSAAVHAIRSVHFKPGRYNGEPIPVRMSLPIRFQLQQGDGLPAGGQTASTEN